MVASSSPSVPFIPLTVQESSEQRIGHFVYKRQFFDLPFVPIFLSLLLTAAWSPLFMMGKPLLIPCISLLSVVGVVWYAFFLKLYRLSDVVVDESGITGCRAGKVCKTILWKDIDEISFGRTVRASWLSPASVSYVVLPKNNRQMRLGIVFYSSIDNLPHLLDILNRYVSRYSIPVIDRCDGTAVRKGRLPIPPS
jgi:hypothetical protein